MLVERIAAHGKQDLMDSKEAMLAAGQAEYYRLHSRVVCSFGRSI